MNTSRTVRSLRKEYALSQTELAELLATSQTIISRIEAGDDVASIETVLALQVVFDVEPRMLFHPRYRRVEDAVMRRALKLDRRVAGKADSASRKKRELLSAMVNRANPSSTV